MLGTKPENIILAGVWYGASHPPINTFMQPLKESLLALETSGNVYYYAACLQTLKELQLRLQLE